MAGGTSWINWPDTEEFKASQAEDDGQQVSVGACSQEVRMGDDQGAGFEAYAFATRGTDLTAHCICRGMNRVSSECYVGEGGEKHATGLCLWFEYAQSRHRGGTCFWGAGARK